MSLRGFPEGHPASQQGPTAFRAPSSALAMTEALPHLRSSADQAALGVSARALVGHYGIAIVGIALALVLRIALASVLEGSASLLFFVPAILFASAFGGWGPGCSPRFSACSSVVFRGGLFARQGRGYRQCLRLRRWSASELHGAANCYAARALTRRQARNGRSRAKRTCKLDPRHHSRRHDRDRRARHHAVVQRRGGAPVRL